MRLEHLVHHDRAARVYDPLLLGEHDAELRAVADGLSDHLLIAILEDMQWQLSAWEYDDLEREQGQQLRLHATIIAFYPIV